MTYGPEIFCALLDRLVESPSVKPACRACQIDASTFWLWLQESSNGNPRFRFEWSGETAFFHEHYATARKRSVVLFESHLRDVVLNGQKRQVVHDGKLQYAFDDSVAIEDRGAKPDVLELLYGRRDPYQRDELGRLVPLTILEPAPAHLSIRAAAATMSAWREHKSVDVNQSISGGVMVLTGRREPDPMRVVEHVEPVEQLAPPVEQEPVEQELHDVSCDAVKDDAAMVDQPGDSPLVRDLRAQLRRGVEHPAPHPVGTAGLVPVGRVDADPPDDLPETAVRMPQRPDPGARRGPRDGNGIEGIGLGTVAPRGMKVL